MRLPRLLAGLVLSAGLLSLLGALPSAPPAGATGPGFGAARAVFVQSDNPSGNTVVAYHRGALGRLYGPTVYPTGGLGGVLAGSVVDHLASQGSLRYDPAHALLYAVNAGSDSVTVFAANGATLAVRQVLPSGGDFPVSVAVAGDLVYVLNALDGGSVAGFRVAGDHLVPLPGSTRPLGLDPTATPQFVTTPGQVAFTPDGHHLLVTTKANGSDVDVFSVLGDGRLSAAPVVDPLPGAVPFALTFDRFGRVVLTEAGTNAVATFALAPDGSLTPLASVPTGQAATCWVVAADGFDYASNAGSASLSQVKVAPGGAPALVATVGTHAGTVDADASVDGANLYVQAGGAGLVDQFAVGSGGTLTPLGSVSVPGAVGGEGIVAI
jgi:6-phosphogluconolactonase (cycloisomerase 2 family)